jgi:hypothetical protein
LEELTRELRFWKSVAPSLLGRVTKRAEELKRVRSSLLEREENMRTKALKDQGDAYKASFESEVAYHIEINRKKSQVDWRILASPLKENSDAEREAGRRLLSGE